MFFNWKENNYLLYDTVKIYNWNKELPGDLIFPGKPKSLVLFSHGCGSSRFSPRNSFAAKKLQKQNSGTFLFNLLTNKEDEVYETRFNTELLAESLICVTNFFLKKRTCQIKHWMFWCELTYCLCNESGTNTSRFNLSYRFKSLQTYLAMNIAAKINAPVFLIVGELDYEVF